MQVLPQQPYSKQQIAHYEAQNRILLNKNGSVKQWACYDMI